MDHPVGGVSGGAHATHVDSYFRWSHVPSSLSVTPQDSYRRVSSHFSMVPSYGVPEGSVLRTLLTGRTLEGDS